MGDAVRKSTRHISQKSFRDGHCRQEESMSDASTLQVGLEAAGTSTVGIGESVPAPWGRGPFTRSVAGYGGVGEAFLA
jgi:hypothetical protein